MFVKFFTTSYFYWFRFLSPEAYMPLADLIRIHSISYNYPHIAVENLLQPNNTYST